MRTAEHLRQSLNDHDVVMAFEVRPKGDTLHTLHSWEATIEEIEALLRHAGVVPEGRSYVREGEFLDLIIADEGSTLDAAKLEGVADGKQGTYRTSRGVSRAIAVTGGGASLYGGARSPTATAGARTETARAETPEEGLRPSQRTRTRSSARSWPTTFG